MAAQQTLIAETIRGMKLALRRRDDDSDSDTSIHQHTNRGNKMKRKAAYVREGRLDTTGGRSYRRKVDHAGYQRYVIHNNPPRFDEDGDLVEGEDDFDEGNASPDEENPYTETKIEYLLAPLTSAAELANHPALSIPYTAKHLNEMVENASDMLHREREALWQMKQLLQRFRGDELWMPLEKVETDRDLTFLDGDGLEGFNDTEASVNDSIVTIDRQTQAPMEVAAPVNGSKENGTHQTLADITEHIESINGIQSIDMALKGNQAWQPAEATANTTQKIPNGTNGELHEAKPTKHEDSDQPMRDTLADTEAENITKADNGVMQVAENGEHDQDNIDPGAVRQSIEPESPPTSVSGQQQHRMTTRAKARTPPDGNGSPSTSPPPSSIPSVSNFFLPAFTAIPDRDFGLPAAEAEGIRRLLLLYVQKQEEVVRGAEALLMGLLKADRTRKQVWSWCKAEGHIGEMSDGEDWYDRDEWALEGDLIKGKEEEDVEDEGVRKGRRRAREGKGKVT